MALSRIELDYTTQNYVRGNASHQQFINQEVDQFHSIFNELCNYDKRTGWLSGLIGFVWLFNSISTMGGLAVSSTYALLSHEMFGRPEYAKRYQEQLKKLLELYNWCVGKSRDKSITTDKTFLLLTETIISYVEYEDLKNPFKDISGVSDEFRNALLLHPLHNNKLIADKQAVSGGMFGLFSLTKKNDEEHAKVNQLNDQSWLSLYNHLYAKIRFDFYSRQTNQPKTLAERCQQIVEPLLTVGRMKK